MDTPGEVTGVELSRGRNGRDVQGRKIVEDVTHRLTEKEWVAP